METERLGGVLQYIQRMARDDSYLKVSDGQLLGRFCESRDDSAFTELLHRHCRLVWGVCRRLTPDAHQAEDVFQAAFLILARRARSLNRQGSVGPWLYTVAYHLALRIKANAKRREVLEKEVKAMTDDADQGEPAREELRKVIDEEIHRLPLKYRGPLILCLLEGHTHETAAQALGLPLGSVSRHLARAREMLQQRLLRRGITPAAGILVGLTARDLCAEAPAGLLASTIRTVHLVESGQSLTLPAAVLAHGVLRKMVLGKLSRVIGILVLALAGTTFGLVWSGPNAKQPTRRQEPPAHYRSPTPNQINQAVDAGLRWLVRQQGKDDSWMLPHRSSAFKPKVAGTAFALLPLYRAGKTHRGNDEWTPVVKGGLQYLLRQQQADGALDTFLYSHGLAAMALCEAYGRTNDPLLKTPAQKALDYTVAAQGAGGGWRYKASAPGRGDTSNTGWQVQALVLGQKAGLHVPARTWQRLGKYLESVRAPTGRYGYTPQSRSSGSAAMTACGLWCEHALPGRVVDPARTVGSLQELRTLVPGQASEGLYYYYYATLAHNRVSADAWHWNRGLRTYLLQQQDAGPGPSRGSWLPDDDRFAKTGGRHMMTSLALLILLARPELPSLPAQDVPQAGLATLWNELATADQARAARPMQQLIAARQTVAFLEDRLKPATPVDAERLKGLIANLNSRHFEVRKKAQYDLEKLGDLARAALEQHLENNPPLETRTRMVRILSHLENVASGPQLRTARSLRILGAIGTPRAIRLLEKMAQGAPGALPTRLAHTELQRQK